MKTDAEPQDGRKRKNDDKQDVDSSRRRKSSDREVVSSRSESSRDKDYYHSRQRRSPADRRSDCRKSNVDERGDTRCHRGSSSERKHDNENCSKTELRSVETSDRDREHGFRSHSPDRRRCARDASREKLDKSSLRSRDPNPPSTRSFNERNRNYNQDNDERTRRSRSRDRHVDRSRYFDSSCGRRSPILSEFTDSRIEGRSLFDKQRGSQYDFKQHDADSRRTEIPDRCPRRQPDRDRPERRSQMETRRDRATERTSFDYRGDEYVPRYRPVSRSSDDLRYMRCDYLDRTDRVDLRSARGSKYGVGDGKWRDTDSYSRHPPPPGHSLLPELNTESAESFTEMHTKRSADEGSISASRQSSSRPRRTNTSESKELQGMAGREGQASSASDQDFKDIDVSNQQSQIRRFGRLSRSPYFERKTNRSRSCEKSQDSFKRHDRQISDIGYHAYGRNSHGRSRSPRPPRLDDMYKNESAKLISDSKKANPEVRAVEKDPVSSHPSDLPSSSSVPVRATFTYPLSSSLSWPSSQSDTFYCSSSERPRSGFQTPEVSCTVMRPGWPTDIKLQITSDVSSTSHPQVSPIQSAPVVRLVDPRLASLPAAKALASIAQQNPASDGLFRVPTVPVSAPHLSAAAATTTDIYGDSPLLDEPSLSSPVAICEATSGSTAVGNSSSGSLPLDVSEYTDMVQSLDSVELKKMLDAVTMVKTTLEKTVLFVDENECAEIDKQHKASQMEAVAEEVKAALKPFFLRNEIDKEEYKDIMRRAVPKIASSKHSTIDKKKIRSFVTDYVAKVKAAQKRVMTAKIHMLQQQQQQQQQQE